MRRFLANDAGVCVVRVRLRSDRTYEIVTSAEHAIEILGGTTAIPARLVTIFDRDGKRLSVRQLIDLPAPRS